MSYRSLTKLSTGVFVALSLTNLGNAETIDFDVVLDATYTAAEDITIIDGTGGPIRVVLDGGDVPNVSVSGGSTFEVLDGLYDDVMSFDHSNVITRGGRMMGDGVSMRDNTTLLIYDGYFHEDIYVEDNSIANLYGGDIDNGVRASGHATINLYGSDRERNLSLSARDQSTINIFGVGLTSAFQAEGEDDEGIPWTSYLVTGHYSDGTEIDVSSWVGANATVNLIAVPEPAMSVAFAIGLLFVFKRGT